MKLLVGKIVKNLKKNYKIFIGIIIGAVIFGSIGVYAASVISATNVGYSDNASLGVTNVQDAIDKLYAKADNQYFDFATAEANTTGKVFASKKGVCISRNKTVYCFKTNNWNVEKTHIQEVFSDVSCDVRSSRVDCDASDFRCYVDSDGYVNCYARPGSSRCAVSSNGSLLCT